MYNFGWREILWNLWVQLIWPPSKKTWGNARAVSCLLQTQTSAWFSRYGITMLSLSYSTVSKSKDLYCLLSIRPMDYPCPRAFNMLFGRGEEEYFTLFCMLMWGPRTCWALPSVTKEGLCLDNLLEGLQRWVLEMTLWPSCLLFDNTKSML